jgi:integrase
MKQRKYLTTTEVATIMGCAREGNRHGHRDATMLMLAFRHALRACEVVALRWNDIDFSACNMFVRRGKHGIDSVHPLHGEEIRALRKLKRETESAYVFTTERNGPFSVRGYRIMVERIGAKAGLDIGTSSHMLRHACGFKLANQGVDTRSLQQYMGHRKIENTVIYTQLAPGRFKDFWRD